MAQRIVAGVFPSVAAAEQARACLIQAGIPDERVGVSAELTVDDVAAECPGQSYFNQPGQEAEIDPTQPYADAARGGTCVLRVDLSSGQSGDEIDRILHRCGAQQTTHRH